MFWKKSYVFIVLEFVVLYKKRYLKWYIIFVGTGAT
jgi:hypothetical protein